MKGDVYMFESINQFKELMNAKKIYTAEIITVPGWRKSFTGVRIQFDCMVRTFAFETETELKDFIKDLQDIGMEIEGL
jgi:hypothetical protein